MICIAGKKSSYTKCINITVGSHYDTVNWHDITRGITNAKVVQKSYALSTVNILIFWKKYGTWNNVARQTDEQTDSHTLQLKWLGKRLFML